MSEALSLKTLLPPNATDQERALEAALYPATDLPVAINTLWNPATCPEPLLPWLAWTLSVDEWDPDWTVAIKRTVIAESMAVHLVKGTVASVRRVLAAVGVPAATLTEWWQTPADDLIALVHSAEPYTYTIGLDAVNKSSTQLLGPEIYASLSRLIGHTQPARCRMSLYLDARIGMPLNIGGASRLTQFARVTGVDDPGINLMQSLNLGGAVDLTQFIRFVTARPMAWVRTLLFTDEAETPTWVRTLLFTDEAGTTSWSTILLFTDESEMPNWLTVLLFADESETQVWDTVLLFTDEVETLSWFTVFLFTDEAETSSWDTVLLFTDEADLPGWLATRLFTDESEV